MPRERIDRDWIALHGAARRDGHARLEGSSQYWNTVVDKRDGRPIGLGYIDTYYKPTKRNGERGGRTERSWSVVGHDAALGTLDEALEILAIQRAGVEPNEVDA